MKIFLIVLSVILVLGCLFFVIFGKGIVAIYKSFKSFKPENLAYTFQHTPEIQPVTTIKSSDRPFLFLEGKHIDLPTSFEVEGKKFDVDKFLEDTGTTAMLVVKDDQIRFEKYYQGGNKDTSMVSNSMGKSFVSALFGIAVQKGYISSVNDPIGKYIPEFRKTELADIPIKACLQMASGIDFDETKDVNTYSMKVLFGKSPMKTIAQYKTARKPFTARVYQSINTVILAQIIQNTTNMTLSEFMEKELWSKIGTENDAYWTLSNGKENAMGGLSLSLRDYARFGRLYLNNGMFNGVQILSPKWVEDSTTIKDDFMMPGKSSDAYDPFGYGYQWWIPEGNEGEYMAIGVFGQWLYINPSRNIIIVKTSADANFDRPGYELENLAFIRAVADTL